MLNITHYQRNANQNLNEVSFLEQAIEMPEFWFYIIPKPYKNIFVSFRFALGS